MVKDQQDIANALQQVIWPEICDSPMCRNITVEQLHNLCSGVAVSAINTVRESLVKMIQGDEVDTVSPNGEVTDAEDLNELLK